MSSRVVQPLRTCSNQFDWGNWVKLPYAPSSLSQTQVRRAWTTENSCQKYPGHPVPSVKQWFKKVWRAWTTPNSCQTTLYTQFPLSNGGSSWF